MKETRGFKWGTAALVVAVIIELFILAAIGARGATPTPTPSPAAQPMKVETKSHLVLPPDPPSPVAPADFDFSGVKVIGLPQTTGNSGTRLLTGGGVAWTGTGLNFIISAATYLINGTAYASPQTPVTLAAADPDDDRIDVFYTDSSSSAGKITGTPGGPPLEPQVNPLTQLRLTTAYVPAGAGTPLITNEEIYLENTEWTTSTNSSGTIALASTNNPYAGSKCVEATNAANGNYWSAVKPASGTVNLSDYASLVIQLRSKATWPKQKSLSLFFLNGSSTVGNPVSLKDGDFNFNSSNTTTYQQIVIPASRFNTGSAPVTTLRIAVTGGGGGNIGWYMDNVVLQTGLISGGGSGDFSTNTNSSVAGQVVVAADTTGKLGAFDSHTGIATLNSGVLGAITGTTVGQNFLTLTNPSAITFPRINADNTVDALSASAFRAAIGAGAGGGDVSSDTSTSVDGEVATFKSTTGKLIQRATGTGIATLTSGVLGVSGTSTAATFGTIELGAASDTTIARSSAGHISVEGSAVGLASDTLSFFTASTSNTIGVGHIELGAASDTTVDRNAAGIIQVEGVAVPTISSTHTLTNKRITPRVTTITSSATPTINTDNCDAVTITALAAAITSMTTNLSGTPNNFDRLVIRFKDDGTGRSITWGSSFASSQATLPTTTVAGKVTTVGLMWDSVKTKWVCLATDQEP